MKEEPNYYAIIPANVRYNKKLKDKAKLLYGEITALSNKEGYCYASNRYFAELYGVSQTTISLLIKNLVEEGYLESEIIYKDGTKEILNRYLRILKEGYLKNLKEGYLRKVKDNNTSNNNTSNNKKENIIKEKYGELKNVLLTKEEYNKLKEQFINYKEKINNLSYYIGSTGKVYKSHYLTILNWARKDKKNNESIPEWFDKEINKTIATNDEKMEMENLLKEFI